MKKTAAGWIFFLGISLFLSAPVLADRGAEDAYFETEGNSTAPQRTVGPDLSEEADAEGTSKPAGKSSDDPKQLPAPKTSLDEEFEKEYAQPQRPDAQMAEELAAAERKAAVNKTSSLDKESVSEKEGVVEKEDKRLPGGYVKMSGKYRLAGGWDDDNDFILNEAHGDFQERNFRYLFGERLENTHDRAIYSQYLLNLDVLPTDKITFYTQLVADPWSWTGTTGEQVKQSDIGGEIIRYDLKYWGNINSTLNEIYRTNNGDSVGFPLIKVHDGHLTSGTVAHGFFDFNPATEGIPFTIPEHDIDYEFRPIRKLWMDYTEDQWHIRAFALADESQALTTDDPIGLSNHRDYWQQSPWLYQYKPVQFFTDGSIKRGYYSDNLSFLARDSEGNRLVLLRGVSFEGEFGKLYIASTVAAPFTPWDQDYFAADNIPGAVRVKFQATDQLMLGSTYTFRSGLINESLADFSQVVGVDAKYDINEKWALKAEVAGSYREKDMLTDDRIRADFDGYAYKAMLEYNDERSKGDQTQAFFHFTLMEDGFDPLLSRFTNTRDDRFWGQHITFNDFSPDLEYFRLGDGIDVNRYVFRFQWRERRFKEKFENLFDVRNVHKTSNDAYKETVLRDEITYRFTPQLTGKALFRWQGLPKTTAGQEPFISNFYVFNDFVDPSSLVQQNAAIQADKDPSRFTYSAGLQYVFNPQWTAEGILEISNDISDFPRGLLNDVFRDANDRVEGILLDHITSFLYGQTPFGLPPYSYDNIFKERVIYKPDDKTTITFHATQNTFHYAAGIDDNINHEGVSIAYQYSKKLSFFVDFTHSRLIDVPRMIDSNFAEMNYDDHFNFYGSIDYKINSSQLFRAEYGVLGMGTNAPHVSPYYTTGFSLPTIDTEHLLRFYLTGDF